MNHGDPYGVIMVRDTYSLRMPIENRRKAEALAKEKRWSLNTWLNEAVEEKLEREAAESKSEISDE